MEKEKREREKREENERAAKRQKNVEGSGPSGGILQQQNDCPAVLLDRKFYLEKVKHLTCPADDQVLGDTDGQILGTELAIDLGHVFYFIEALNLMPDCWFSY